MFLRWMFLCSFFVFLSFRVFADNPLTANPALQNDLKEGEASLDEGDYEAAIASFKKALETYPDSPELYNLLGITYLKQGESIQSAVGSFQEAIRVDPNFRDGYFNLAVTYAGLGKDPAEAKKYFEKTIELAPNFAGAYLGLGWIYLFEDHDVENAVMILEKAIKLKSDLAEAHFALGAAYISMGKRALALTPITTLRDLNRQELAANLEAELNKQQEFTATVANTQAQDSVFSPQDQQAPPPQKQDENITF